tara:strand:+ start:147 stop:776 length:630 start_codon:yes stop_codon:yes gene_type:complete
MPNWFTGTIQIIGSPENMKEIHQWTLAYNDDTEEPQFNTLCPLPSMGDTWDDDKWVYEEACEHWRSKWGIRFPTCIHSAENNGQHYIDFMYDSAWDMPMGLFNMLEKKYNVSVYSEGYEPNNGIIEVWKDGHFISNDMDFDSFPDWYADVNDLNREDLPEFNEGDDIHAWNNGCIDDEDTSNYAEYIDYLVSEANDEINYNGGYKYGDD